MRLAFSITISATCTWRSGGSSNVELITSAPTQVRSMSVTSSGRSSMSRMNRYASGLFLRIALASFCISTVLPVRGGATMMPRVPLPMGQTKSMRARGQFFGSRFEDEPLRGKQRREVIEVRFLLRLVRVRAIDGLDFEQRKETFLVFRRTNLARDQIARLQIKPADLRRRDVNILRARQVIETHRAQEAEAFAQNFQHAF